MLPLVLAQLDTPPPAALASWLSVAMYLCVCVCTVVVTAVAIKNYNAKAEPTQIAQPLHTKEIADFATKPELRSLETKMDQELGRERGARKQIHMEIAGIQVQLGKLETETGVQTRQLHQLDNKMDRVLERLPRA